MARGLTAKAVENARPGASRREISDAGCRGLHLIVQPSGAKSWAVRYRHHGKTRKLTLPGFPSLGEARRAAVAALDDVAKGIDPATKSRDQLAAIARADAERGRDTFEALAKQFMELHAARKTREATQAHYQRMLIGIAAPAWRGRTVHEIRRRDIVALLDDVASTRPILANRTAAVLSVFFRWCLARDIIETSPCAGIRRPAPEVTRDRILSDDEVRDLWGVCDVLGDRIGPFVKVLLLTGQRRSEVAGMRLSEIEGDIWTLPAERVKNKRLHSVPLSAQVLKIIEAMELVGDHIFTDNPRKRIDGDFSRWKRKIDVLMKPTPHWTFHDLRRTVASGMAKLGIEIPVIEKCLNHAGGVFAGIVGTYQRHEYASEKRTALQRWADHVDQIVGGRPATVLSFGRRS
jgi:integrase